MAIKTLSGKTTKTEIARLLGVSEGTVRYHVSRMKAEVVDGRSRQLFKAQQFAEAIEHWRGQQQGPLNLSLLHEWLRIEKQPALNSAFLETEIPSAGNSRASPCGDACRRSSPSGLGAFSWRPDRRRTD